MKNITKNISSVTISVLVTLAASIAVTYAAWVNPTCDPNVNPAPCNTPEPLNVGAARQTKSGGVTLGNVGATGYVDSIGTLTTAYLDVRPQNAVSEGGEILLNGAAANPDWAIDLLGGRFRLHTGGVERLGLNSGGGLTVSGTINASGNISTTGTRFSPGNANTYFYGDGTNTAARQPGSFYVQNAAGTGFANAQVNDVWINSIGRWASTLVPGAAPTLNISYASSWNGCGTGSNGGGGRNCAATAVCPVGTSVVGGGCSIGGAQQTEHRDAMIPISNGYYCNYWGYDWTGDGDWSIDVFAWAACARLN